MKNRYVVRKTTKSGNFLYLHPSCGFCVEECNGGVYTFTSKRTAWEKRGYANSYLGCYDTLKDEILTYDEYLAERDRKHDQMECFANSHGFETHRENHEFYVYLTGEQFGKPVAIWHNMTLYSPEHMERYLLS